MPKEYVPANCFPDDEVKAFVYFDSEDRIVATTEHPHVMLGGKFGICTIATVLLSGPIIQATVSTVKKSKILKNIS